MREILILKDQQRRHFHKIEKNQARLDEKVERVLAFLIATSDGAATAKADQLTAQVRGETK